MDFEHQVQLAIASLPADLRSALENVAVTVEDVCPEDPDLYGLYEGTPLIEPGDWAGRTPAHIRIFRRPLLQDFPGRDELVEEIRVTVLHELAHHFGIDEDRLDQLGYG